MNARRTLSLVVVLALLCVGGIVGMLLADGAWDWLFFALTALPLVIGALRVRISDVRGRSTAKSG